MSISIGGMSLLSLRNPYSELVGTVIGKTDLRSFLCLVVLFIIVLVLAYLTNPSEANFRAYLTEQSFRQHLSRLDDHVEDRRLQHDSRAPQRSHVANHYFDHATAFHFASRASIALKTPKHVFHSFGIFTIAAMLPLAKSTRSDDRDAQRISESWYFGAFGHWWRGGIIEAWYQDVIARSKDEEGWSSGILSMKNLDLLNDCTGLPFTTKNLPSHVPPRGSPPRLRNRERPQKQTQSPARSSSPPPLPQSASLPLHTPKHSPGSSLDRLHLTSVQPVVQNQTSDQPLLGVSLPSIPSTTLFDQSPRIAEVLRQINQSKAQVLELRSQYNEYQASATESHTALQAEVGSLRERKRQEEASKVESKVRTKTLDDSKRGAEALKREAEKKLKAAQNARDNATQRIDHLDQEIHKLHQRLSDDQESMKESEKDISEAEQELIVALERKRQELKVAEDVVAALNHRARVLEDQVSAEREHLADAREQWQLRRQYSLAPSSPVQLSAQPDSPSFISINPFDLTNRAQDVNVRSRTTSLNMDPFSILSRRLSLSRDNQVDINAFGPNSRTHQGLSSSTSSAPTRSVYPSYEEDSFGALRSQAPSYNQSTTSTFSPFADLDRDFGVRSVVSPTSQSLVPSTLIASLGTVEVLPRSFQSESDVYLDKEWRNTAYAPIGNRAHEYQDQAFSPINTSPVSIQSSVFTDSTESRHYPPSDSPMNLQRASLIHRSNSDPHTTQVFPNEEFGQVVAGKGPRRWFSTNSKEKSKKGLNPDAKVFSLSRKSPPASGYDALNPNGLCIASAAPSTSLFSRVFAPSPAEREALQRALGSSTNTSLERLPSLSEVGSIPSSPSHNHATPSLPLIPQHGGKEMTKVLPSWLQSLPMIRKPATNFSPWADEEGDVPASAGYR